MKRRWVGSRRSSAVAVARADGLLAAFFSSQITVFTQNFSVLATQASLLAGLGYSGLTMTPVWAKSGSSTKFQQVRAFGAGSARL